MSGYRILADENIPLAEQYFGDLGEVRRFVGRELTAAALGAADILLVRSVTPVGPGLLRDSGVRFVGTATSGVDHLDRAWLDRAGIPWARAAGSNANSVVEYLLAAVAEAGDFLERLLSGGTLGLVGFGHIGRAVAARCDALGISTRVNDPWLEQGALPGAASLEQVLGCDVISLHCELTDRQPWPSRHLLGAAQLARLGPGQLLVNASRGPVIDGEALAQRLRQPGAPVTVLDVWEREPEVDEALLGQVLLGTAHIAGYSADGKELATRMLRDAAGKALGMGGAPDAADAEAKGIEYPPGLAGAPAIRQLLRSRYDITADDRALREGVTGQPPEQAMAAFDRLRRDYPERRELAGSLVLGVDTVGQAGLCRALGCRVQGQGA